MEQRVVSAARCNRRSKIVAASGLIAWLAAPFVVRAAQFNEVFNRVPQSRGSTTQSTLQSTINALFNNRIYSWLIYAVSVAAVFGIFYGGFLYVTAKGKPEQAEVAKKAILYAVIGILVLGGMYALFYSSRNLGDAVAKQKAGEAL